MATDYELVKGFLHGLKPDRIMTVSEWADSYRFLSPMASSEPGAWRTSRVPHVGEIQDKLSAHDPCQEIVFMKAAQVAGTEAGNNWIGYIMDVAPGPVMMVMPTDDTVKRNSKVRIAPMIEATPRLRDKVAVAKSRDGDNTTYSKSFPGGVLSMTGANSAVGLRSMPVRYLFLDEIDAYPEDLDGEGSPIELARARTRTFPKRKVLLVSTPTVDGSSAIQREYENTDQRRRFVPCPHCGAFQTLKWEQMTWDEGDPDSARYKCEHCGDLIEERHKPEMFANAEWRPTRPGWKDPKRAGFHINSLYSPLGWYSWSDAVRAFEDINGDANKAKAFVNTVLGEAYVSKGDSPPWENLYNRRELYATNTVDNSVAFITAGVDIQKDRIEVEIVGWCKGKRSYSIDYRVLIGETNERAVWDKLAAVVGEFWKRNDGAELPLRLMAVDTGYNTNEVYKFCRRFDVTRVIPVKGSDTLGMIVSQPRAVDVSASGKKIGRVKVWNVGVSVVKSELYGWLRLEKAEDGTAPDGYCHFPQYEQAYFRGLTAEQLEFKVIRGFRKYQWVKKYDRNEPLDTRVYARAAASVIGLDRLNDAQLDEMQASYDKRIETEKREKRKVRESIWS